MAKKYSALDAKKHGVGGVIKGALRKRKQDNEAQSTEMYAVIFFPKIQGIGPAHVSSFGRERSLANSPKAAKSKFMDGIAKGQKWKTYKRAGHRIRKLKIVDMGDA